MNIKFILSVIRLYFLILWLRFNWSSTHFWSSSFYDAVKGIAKMDLLFLGSTLTTFLYLWKQLGSIDNWLEFKIVSNAYQRHCNCASIIKSFIYEKSICHKFSLSLHTSFFTLLDLLGVPVLLSGYFTLFGWIMSQAKIIFLLKQKIDISIFVLLLANLFCIKQHILEEVKIWFFKQ